eukprot:4729163-Pyramimonas_sp.AAC.1
MHEMHEMDDYKAAKEKGEQQPEYLKALDFVGNQSDNAQLLGACRMGSGWGEKREGACSRGLALPDKLWRRSPCPNSRSDKW